MILQFFRAIITFFLEIAETAILAILIFLALYLFLVRPHQIRGDSMLPNFHNGEYLLTEMVSHNLLKKDPQRGEVVVFRSPEQPNLDFIKRIIALPGEKIKLQNGKVFIINEANPEGFLLREDYLGEGTVTEGRRTIQEGEVFEVDDGYIVMGDNRERSSDAREWGVIERENIIGRVWLRYWPPEAVALLRPAEYQLAQ
ncbi:MAG: signal peptidase I [candidate division WWE3 bacterium]|nr:signal peptidase I [candidate division WWE3 bacterium]